MSIDTVYERLATYEYIGEPARVYIWNEMVPVVLSEKLAARYDVERAKQTPDVVADGRSVRLVPEIIFDSISKLPNPQIVSEIIVQNIVPEGEEAGQVILGKQAAESFISGRMVLPAVLREDQLDDAVTYGWTRLLWFRYEVEAHYFSHASTLERHEFAINDLSVQTAVDDWALCVVHGFLKANDEEFEKFIDKAPLRAVFIAKALEDTFDEYPEFRTEQIQARILTIGTEVLPKAQLKLLSIFQQNEENIGIQQTVFKLMLVLCPEEQLTLVPLKNIDLSYEPHNNVLLAKLSAMPQIESLNLSDSMLSREGTDFLKNLVNLRELNAANTRIMSSSLEPLRGLPVLENLNVSGTRINDFSLTTFARIKSLKHIDVTDTDLTNVNDVRDCVTDCEVIG